MRLPLPTLDSRRPLVALTLCLAAPLWAAPRSEVVDIPSRPGVMVRTQVITPSTSEPPRAALVLLAGGHGGLQLGPQGIPGWGAKGASAVLARYGHLDDIPERASAWEVPGVSGGRAVSLSASLREHWDEALLYRDLATLRTVEDGVPIRQRDPDELRWDGAPRAAWDAFCDEWGLDRLRTRGKIRILHALKPFHTQTIMLANREAKRPRTGDGRGEA